MAVTLGPNHWSHSFTEGGAAGEVHVDLPAMVELYQRMHDDYRAVRSWREKLEYEGDQFARHQMSYELSGLVEAQTGLQHMLSGDTSSAREVISGLEQQLARWLTAIEQSVINYVRIDQQHAEEMNRLQLKLEQITIPAPPGHQEIAAAQRH